jgi:hypothetical protein
VRKSDEGDSLARNIPGVKSVGKNGRQITEMMSGSRISLAYLVLLLVAMILTAHDGADASHYRDWARYFATSDLSVLSPYPKSPTGTPLVIWAYGPGLLAAIPNVLLRIQVTLPMGLIAAFLGVANVALLLYIAKGTVRTAPVSDTDNKADTWPREETHRWELPALVLAAVVLFTPAGFYFNAYSGESWTILLVLCGLAIVQCRRREPLHADYVLAIMLGIVLYFLLLIKFLNLMLCVSLAIIFLVHAVPKPVLDRRKIRTVLSLSALISVAPVVGVILLSTYNYFVNGHIFASPYSFGDAQFSALSFHNLKLVEVLFSSWHGLFFYHPLIPVAAFWLLRRMFTCRLRPADQEFWIIGSAIGALLFQTLIQSAWFAWWMGLGTYGARGFVGVTILMAYAVLRSNRNETREIGKSLSWLIAGVGAFQAYLLFKRESNFIDYRSFASDLLSLSSRSMPFLLIALGFIVIGLVLWQSLRITTASPWIVYYLLGMSLLPSLGYPGFSDEQVFLWLHETPPGPTRPFARSHVPAALAALAILAWQSGSLSHKFRQRFSLAAVFAGAIAVFCISLVSQVRLLQDLQRTARNDFQGGHILDCVEIRDSYDEYQQVKGYDAEKAALFKFLVRNRCLARNEEIQ